MTCVHHGGFKALCAEWLYGTQYVLTCPGCRAIIYPCDCCHQVAAHPADPTASHSACRECGFLTLINPQLRRLLRLPALLPLSSATTLSIQSSISLPLYRERREAAYQSAFTAYKRAEQAANRRQRADEAKDGGESDTTDHAIRPAQQTTSTTKKRKRADTVLPNAGESTLLRLREELLAMGQLSSSRLLAPPSFWYGVQPLDSVPFTSHHLESLSSTLRSVIGDPAPLIASLSTVSLPSPKPLTSTAVSSFHDQAVFFFSARAKLVECIQQVRQGWSILSRVQRTYAELEAEVVLTSANKHEQPIKQPRATDMHTDDEADEHDEHKAEKDTAATSTASASSVASTHSREVQRGVMAIVENVMRCRLQHTCNQLHIRTASHLPLLSAINTLLGILYVELLSTLRNDRSGVARVDVLCVERCEAEVEAGDGTGGGLWDGRVDELLWCCWMLRCCYCGVSAVLQRAVYWSEVVDEPRQQSAVAVEVNGSSETGAGDTLVMKVAGSGAAKALQQPAAVEK